MAEHLTSAFGGDTITVDESIKDPTFIPERVLENLDGAFLEAALFRDGGSNDGVVAYREAASPYLNDDAENVAEFAEIPVSDLNRGKLNKIIGVKTALAIRISWEMRRFNKIDMLSLQTTALQNTMVRNGVDATLKAFDSAGVQQLAVASDWEANDADPVRDILRAKRLISLAKSPDDENALMGYKPNLIVMNDATLDLAMFSESVQKLYRGNVADKNPRYTGVSADRLAGLQIVTSPWIPEGDCYVMESGTAGFVSEAQPLTMTPLYSEGGEQTYGGPNQSWRTDAFRHRIIAVDNPLAVVKITGIEP